MKAEDCEKDESGNVETKETEIKNPELDYCNELFDPLKFLYAPNVKLTKKKTKKFFDNIAAFENALKKQGIWDMNCKKQKAVTEQKADETPQNPVTHIPRFSEPAMMPTTYKPRAKSLRSLNKNMEKAAGPYSVFRICVEEKNRIKVSTRNKHGIHGYAIGILISFDKHWNMLLCNVEESWKRRKYKYDNNKLCAGNPEDCRRRLNKLGITLPVNEVKSIDRKHVQISRQIDNLFIRGEQVAFVQIL